MHLQTTSNINGKCALWSTEATSEALEEGGKWVGRPAGK